MRDPYAVYARHILGLRPLDAIDADPGAAERGSMIHAAIDDFMRAHPDKLPRSALRVLLRTGKQAFGAALAQPGVWAFWWPRFERIAEWFIAHERGYRPEVRVSRSEMWGELVIEAPGGDFTLTAKADRVDELMDGGLAIIDYKTGRIPKKKEIALGFAPQLPLEAAIAAAGGFADMAPGEAARLEFWQLSGGDPAGKTVSAGDDVVLLGADARDGLERLIAHFDDPAVPYLSRPDPEWAPRYSDYVHLARIHEWSVPPAGEAE
jgi:ATP-dependent helicase/nuclease subunit B